MPWRRLQAAIWPWTSFENVSLYNNYLIDFTKDKMDADGFLHMCHVLHLSMRTIMVLTVVDTALVMMTMAVMATVPTPERRGLDVTPMQSLESWCRPCTPTPALSPTSPMASPAELTEPKVETDVKPNIQHPFSPGVHDVSGSPTDEAPTPDRHAVAAEKNADSRIPGVETPGN